MPIRQIKSILAAIQILFIGVIGLTGNANAAIYLHIDAENLTCGLNIPNPPWWPGDDANPAAATGHTVCGNAPQGNRVMEWTIAQNIRQYDDFILTDNWQDIVDGGYLASPSTGVSGPVPVMPQTPASFRGTCTIYNIQGKAVRAVRGEFNGAGRGLASAERGLPDGLYLARVSGAGAQYMVKRLVLR
jgi:hypothetical protein